MTLFFHYMDSITNSTFTQKYTCSFQSKSTPKPFLRIRHASKHLPHYNLLKEDVIYDVTRGRNNVFCTLCLWTAWVLRNGGYISTLYIGGKGIDLGEVVA